MTTTNGSCLVVLLLSTVGFTAQAARGQSDAPVTSPADLPGLVFWLDASDTSTLFADDAKTVPVSAEADRIAVWADKSSQGLDAIQPYDEQARPRFVVSDGQPQTAVQFDGERTWLSVDGLAPFLNRPAWTFFLAVRADLRFLHGTALMAAAGNKTRRGFRFAPRCKENQKQTRCVEFKNKSGGGSIYSLYSTSGEWEIWEYRVTDGGATMLVGGIVVGSGGYMHIELREVDRANVGARPKVQRGERTNKDNSEFWPGWIGEIVGYEGALDEEARRRVRTYLVEKWQATAAPSSVAGKAAGRDKRRRE